MDQFSGRGSTGYTRSCNFPLQNSVQPKAGIGIDCFVARFDPAVSSLYYCTLLGGQGDEAENFFAVPFTGGDIAVSAAGSAIVTGYTRSVDFPVVGAVQPVFGGATSDAYVARIDPGPPPTWSNVGGGTNVSTQFFTVPGPTLTMSGPLTFNTELKLDLVHGGPSVVVGVFIALTSAPKSYLGGTLHAYPVADFVTLATNAAGELHSWGRCPDMASGTKLWFQAAVPSGFSEFGALLSNGVVGTVP